jgi:hypothetical protein
MSWLSSSSSSLSSKTNVTQEEKSQLLIVFENAKINYSKTQTIDFKPYMLGIPSGTGSSSSRSGSGSSSSSGLAIYLPERHNVEYVFNRYIKIYKNAVGNPATVFIDNRTYAEYTQFANELIKNEKTTYPSPGPPVAPRGPHDLIDDDKARMINNNISFVINTLFRKNRIITTGDKKDRIQTTVAEKPVPVDQNFYLDSYNVHAVSYSPSGGTKKYESGDVRILEKEGVASELKAEIDGLAALRQNAEKIWIDAKQAYARALAGLKTGAISPAAKNTAQDTMNAKRDEYLEARTNEKEKIEERNKVVSEINQLRYGVYPKAVTILDEIRKLREGNSNSHDRDIFGRSSTSTLPSLKSIKKDIITITNEIVLLKAEKKKHEDAYTDMAAQIQEEKMRILIDILRQPPPIPNVDHAYATTPPDPLILGQKARYDKANETVIILIRNRATEERAITDTQREIDSNKVKLKKYQEAQSKKEREINQKEMELEDYTLRTYLYKIVGASFITKYASNGKKNPQFELLERKGYNESVKGSAEYQKNANQMIKDAPMFSQASCLQKKTEIQTMFDNMLSRAKEKVANAIDNQIGGTRTPLTTDPTAPTPTPTTAPTPTTPIPVLFPELRKKFAELQTMYAATTEKYNNFSVIPDLVLRPAEPPNPNYFTHTDKCDIDINCTATIKESTEETKRKEEELKRKFERMTKISLGTYPPLLMPQGYYKMHQMVYYESSNIVDLDCENPPLKKDLTIANLDMVLNPSKIPTSFPALMSDDDNIKYNKSIKEKYLFRRAQINI